MEIDYGTAKVIEYVSGVPSYDEPRSRGWYFCDPETGEGEGPFETRRAAECAAGRPEDADEGEVS